jgi:SAM-dependent methyltransferase
MSAAVEPIRQFVEYARTLSGDEKGEAQVFCDRLFQAFGHGGYKEAGATLEFRVKGQGKSTRFADLLWRPRLLIEMKKRGEKLQRHYTQAFEYWLQLVPQRPKYVVLCNFDAFWIYDFDIQLNDPVDTVALGDLPARYTAFNFLFPVEKKPQFGNNRVDVTRAAADKVAGVFNSMVARGESREQAQRFALQCVVAMFSEDAELLPRDLFSELLDECKRGENTYDLVGGLFRQMNNPNPARGGRYKGIRYFNGGVFQTIEPVELIPDEIDLLLSAATENWSKVQPPIFGTLFQSSMDKEERHAFGAHFTSEADIQKVVLPTIVRPWRERIEAGKTLKELRGMLEELRLFRVLDPACGSGNFLYVAYRELKRLELSLMAKIHAEFGKRAQQAVGTRAMVSTKQLFGMDIGAFAVELAKVTLMIAKELAIDESRAWLDDAQLDLPIEFDAALPLDNLDENILCCDSLFSKWPQANAIVGNPPYLGSRYLAKEHGYKYANAIYDAFPDVPKMADYCVHWFRLTHERLPAGGRAGLVGTNSVRQNESREASLDYIVDNGGTITEAVSTQVWSGDAAVHVSIVNWIKGESKGVKHLYTQLGDRVDSPWMKEDVESISPHLSTKKDTRSSQRLKANERFCFTGQNPVNAGFFLEPEEALAWLKEDAKLKDVLFPYMIGRDLLEEGGPTRWIIDFAQRDQFAAMKYQRAFERVKERVMPVVLERAEKERVATGKDVTRYGRIAQRWWQFYDYRPGTIAAINSVPRYIACSRVTKRPIIEFVSNAIHADTKLVIFKLADDYSFGILQSMVHWHWAYSRGGTLKGDFSYTSDTVFDTYPWPQKPSADDARKVADAAVALRKLRRRVMADHDWNLRDLYRTLETPGQSPLRTAHESLDASVRKAYGMTAKADPLDFLLALNAELADREASMRPVVGPGLPPAISNAATFITDDSICIG